MSSISDREEKAFISGYLNTVLFHVFVTGLHFGVYCVTVHIYASRSRVIRKRIITALTLLFILAAAQTSTYIYYLNYAFFNGGDSRRDFFVGINVAPPAAPLLWGIFNNIGYCLADGLMIWRCYHVYGRSFLSISMPFTFYILEIGLTIASAVLHCLQFYAPQAYPFPVTNKFDVVDGALGAVTAVTSLLATLMIGYRIYSVTNSSRHFANKYRRIVDVLVQSSLIYSLAIVAFDICVFLGSSTKYSSPYEMIVTEYIASFTGMITGLAPTLMVGRIAILCGEQEEHTVSLTSWRV